MQNISFERFNPFRQPNWRYERVLQLVDRHPRPGRSSRRDDEFVQKARSFVIQYRNAKTDEARRRLQYKHPGIFFAYLIHERAEEDFEVAFMLEARLLAGQDNETIAEAAHTIPDAIAWYERLFFNVRDRLRSHDWILKHVLMPSISRSQERVLADMGEARFVRVPLAEPFWDASLKFFAYFGGKHVVDFMLSGFQRGVFARSQEDVGEWLNNYIDQATKRRTAMAIGHLEVNKYNVLELMQIHLRLVEIQKASAKEGGAVNDFERSVEAFLSDIPWSVGKDGAQQFAGTAVADLDTGAAELRADETLRLSSGQNDGKMIEVQKEVGSLVMPAPPVRVGQEDQDGNAQ